jgi:hypothetical protein
VRCWHIVRGLFEDEMKEENIDVNLWLKEKNTGKCVPRLSGRVRPKKLPPMQLMSWSASGGSHKVVQARALSVPWFTTGA